MSGIEIVGVILGLYPLVVDAIVLCRKVRNGEALTNLLADIQAEKVIFCNWAEHLCNTRVADANLKEILDPKTRTFELIWNNEAFLTSLTTLRDREATITIVITLRRIHHELVEIQKAVAVLRTDSPDWISRARASVMALRASLDTSGLKRRLIEVHKLNERLYRLYVSSPPRNHPLASQVHRSMTPISCAPYATNLFHAVQRHYQCHCVSPHPTKLRLPNLVTQSTRSSDASKPTLQMVFGLQDDLSHPLVTGADLTTTSTEEKEDGNNSLSMSASLSELSRQETMGSSLHGGVSMTSSTTQVFTPRAFFVDVVECDGKRNDEIKDLCRSIQDLEQDSQGLVKGEGLGVLRGKTGTLYALQDVRAMGGSDSSSLISLDEFFTGELCRVRRHRINLALQLSWAVIQLQQTPWIPPCWSWSDFSTINPGKDQRGTPIFVTREFFSSQVQRHSTRIAERLPSTAAKVAVGNPILARLGYALIELAFGRRLSSLEGVDGPSCDDRDLQELLTARHLLDDGQVRNEEGEVYHRVVETCLLQRIPRSDQPGLKKLNACDPSFEQEVMQAVVRPLLELYRNFWNDVLPMAKVF